MNSLQTKPRVGFVVGGRYKLVACLKRSTLKSTYSCHDLNETQKPLILKTLNLAKSGSGSPGTWSRDFSFLQRIRHAHLVRIVDFGIVENSSNLYFVEEWVEGTDLYSGTEGMDNQGVLDLLAELFQTVQYLHTREIIHGGLRPSNIVLTETKGGTLHFKMTDFGTTGLFKDRVPFLKESQGMLSYTAPELVLGDCPDTGSDLYSLGVLAYQTLTRQLPFEDVDPGFLMQKHLQGSPDLRPVERLKGGKYLVRLLQGLLEKDSMKRPASLDEAISLIHSALKDSSPISHGREELESSFTASRIVGREKEMNYLRESATHVRENGRGRTLFLSGEAGSGKTRCLEELKYWGRLEGWRVIEGSCRIPEKGSYGPYRQILAGVRSDKSDAVFHFGETLHGEDSGIFKSSMDYAAGQFRDLLTRELVRHLSERPTLLLLDDFHEADEATSIVLDYLSSDIQAHPVLICVSYRSGEEAGRTLDRVVTLAVRQDRGDALVLEPLPRDSVEELVAVMTGKPQLKKTLGAWVYQHVGGNPFFLEEMLKHLVEQGALRYASGQWRFKPESLDQPEVPDSVGMVIKHRLGQLHPASREAANWLAIINRPISPKLLCFITSLDLSGNSKALKELVHRQMVLTENKDKGETIGFRHALIAEVTRSCLNKKKRQKMHQRIAETLEKEYGDKGHLQELAWHSMEGKWGDKAVGYALALAMQSRMEFSHEIAARCFEYVLDNRGGLSKGELCRVSIDAADTMHALGFPKRAILRLKHEIAGNRNIDRDLKGRMYMQLALSFQHLGDFSSQEVYCKKGLRLFSGPSHSGKNSTKAMLYAELAFGAAIQAHPGRGLVFLKKALACCPDSGFDALLGRIHCIAAYLYRIACNLRQSLIASEKAVQVLSSTGNYYLTCSGFSTLGTILMNRGRFAPALEKHRHAVRLSDKSRSVIPRAQALGNLAECLCRMGRTQEALSTLEGAMKSIGESKNPAINHAFNTILAEVKLEETDFESACRIIQQIGRIPGNGRALYAVGHAHYIAARLYFSLGDFDAAVNFIRMLRRTETAEAPCFERELAEALHARILFERGNEAEAVKRLHHLDRTATRKHWPYQMAIIKLHLCEVLTKQGNLDTAVRYARNGLRLATAMNSIPLMAYGRLLLGILYCGQYRECVQGGSANNSETVECRNSPTLLDAVGELHSSCRLAESSGFREIAWKAHTELYRIYGLLKKENEKLHHAKSAYDGLCKIENRIPSEMRSVFWSAFDRNRIKSELVRFIESVPPSDPGTDIIVSRGSDENQARILFRVSATVNSIRELDPLLEAILDQLIQALAMQRALVFLKEGAREKWNLVKGRSDKKESITDAVTLSPFILEEVGQRGNPVVSANVPKDPRLTGRTMMEPGEPGQLLCAPLKVSGRVIGLLYADHSSPLETLNESTINLFAAFCNLSAIAIDNTIAQQKLVKEKVELEQYVHQVREEYGEIVGKSAVVEKLRDRIAVVAASPLDVLIMGESGTGKELVAQAIHRTCRRSSGKFVPVDCGSFSDSLAESELFGYRKGTFTGASEDRPGLLEAAHGGIVFLDEISNLPFHLQAKLLRVLEEREVRRMGETDVRKIDIQIIAATNRDLLEEIEAGRFREDLYYRLKKMEVRVPSLRERLADIPLLVHSFLRKTAENEEGRRKSISTPAMALLQAYTYPGNIRELLNVVTGAYYSTNAPVIDVENLPPEVCQAPPETLRSEEEMVRRMYRDIVNGNGKFKDRIKTPFLNHQFDASIVRGVMHLALKDSRGRYRDAFARLRIPDGSYAATMQFLKRHRCYLDFRLYRKRKVAVTDE